MVLMFVLALMLPAICWFGLANPNLIPGLFNLPWGDTTGMFLAVAMVGALFFVPLMWMLIGRQGDFAGLWLMQNALLTGGYFFLPESTALLNTGQEAPAIIQAGTLIVIINALGFFILLLTMGWTYGALKLARGELKPLAAPPEVYDRRLLLLLRLAGLFNVGVILLTMAVSKTIPMLAADPEQARYVFDENPATRPLYNLGMSVLPFAVGGLLVMFLRNPRRHLGLDGGIVGAICVAQLLSGNRYTLAIAAMVAITLLSMDRKWPRWLLLAAVMAYLFLFVGLSGLTSVWRHSRDAPSAKNNLLVASFREAYLGNNLVDYHDNAWVFSQWDREPLQGKTFLGGMTEMLPSGLFPMKRQWHLGHVALRLVGLGDVQHFGLRLSCFGESFLNFGFAGVIGLAIIVGTGLGMLLRCLHLLKEAAPPCLARNLCLVLLMQMLLVWTNSSDGYIFWALLAFLIIIKFFVFYLGGQTTLESAGRVP